MTQRNHGALRNAAAWLGVGLSLAVLPGCAGFRAARLYQHATRVLNAGEPERALPELREAARLAPNASEIQNHLGIALAATGHHAEALAAFERAVDLDCSNSAAVHNLAAARAHARSPGGE